MGNLTYCLYIKLGILFTLILREITTKQYSNLNCVVLHYLKLWKSKLAVKLCILYVLGHLHLARSFHNLTWCCWSWTPGASIISCRLVRGEMAGIHLPKKKNFVLGC